MKKAKFFKIFLPLIIVVLFIVIFVWSHWNQIMEQTGSNTESPEDTLQTALGGYVDSTEQNPKANDDPIVPDTAMTDEAILQKSDENESTSGADGGSDEAVEVLSTKDLSLRDLHAAPGQIVRFRVCHSGAVNYSWEYYDMESKEWLPADGNIGEEPDALGRMTAYADFETPVDPEQPEIMIRCLYEPEDKESGEPVSEVAFLKALPQEIRQLALADERIEAEAGNYLSSCDITVKVTYPDNTSEVINGLYGLYFMETEVEEESSEIVSDNGVLTERKVQTVLNHFSQYHLVSLNEENIILDYLPDVESPQLQMTGIIKGTDEEPPEIFKVDILTRETVGIEGEESVTILVSAEDNVTPYPKLKYAVIQKESTSEEDINVEEIAEEEWLDSPKVTMTLRENNMWILCCRDQAGNVSVYRNAYTPEVSTTLAEKPEESQEIERDTQAPVIRNIYVEAE